jgi:hypothetical protein
MTIKALQSKLDRLIKNKDTRFDLWIIPICAIAVACSRLIAAQLSSRVPGATYNFDVLHHWQLILLWCVAPHRLLMLFALLFAIVLSLVALAQKSKLLRITLLAVTLAGTLFIEWSADYVIQNRPLLLRPHRGDPGSQVDFTAAKEAYKIFGLDRYSLPEMLVAAQLYYEQRCVQFKDVYLEDPWVAFTGDTPLGLDVSIGPAQIRKSKIIELVREFPSELKDLREPGASIATGQSTKVNLRAALNKRNAAMLVGAYYASVIRRLERGEPASPDQPPSVTQMIMGLWKKGDPTSRAMALGESYSPGTPAHGQFVVEDLRKIEHCCQSGEFKANEQLYIRTKEAR